MARKRVRLAAVFALVALIVLLVSVSSSMLARPAPAGTFATAPYTVTIRHNIAYGPLPKEDLDLCTPQHARGPLPGVVFFHGGAWQFGDKATFDSYCLYLASRGLVAATVNYRLAPAALWPAQLVDAQLAVRYLRAHAPALNLAPAHLCAFGESAGGHLAVFLGALATIHPGDEAALYANESPQVSCVADEFGPVDLTAPMPMLTHLNTFTTLFGGATLASDPAVYRDASPLFDISSQTAPMLIIQGTRDGTVPPQQSLALAAALRRAGVSALYLSYDGDHALIGLSKAQQDALLARIGNWLLSEA